MTAGKFFQSILPVLALSLMMTFDSGPATADSPGGLGPPPGSYTRLTDDEVIRIPFELYRDDIRMIAEINGREVRMLIDNGSLWDQLLFFGSPRVDQLGFEYDEQIQVGGMGEGESVPSDMASGITVRFPGIEFTDQTAIVTPYQKGEPNPWEGAEGQVSAAFFKNFVVEIDFDEMVLLLIEPDEYVYNGDGRGIDMIPMPNDSRNVPCILELEKDKTISFELLLDLGGVHPLSLIVGSPAAVQLPEGAVESSIGYGMQGEVFGHMGRVHRFSLAGYWLNDVVSAFSTPDASGGMGKTGLIGMPLLSRFNIVFDYFEGKIYLEPNSHFHDPFELKLPRSARAEGD